MPLGDDLIVVSTSEILGNSERGEQGLTISECEQEIAQSDATYKVPCQDLGDISSKVEALRYAWHLRFDTEEEKETGHQWILQLQDKCKQFEQEVNRELGHNDTQWRFMCYHSLSITDGAKAAIKADMKWIVLVLLLSLVMPVLLILKPCGSDNFAMLMLIAVGLFFVTLIAAVGVGSLAGFEFVYSFLVALLFLVCRFTFCCCSPIRSIDK